MKRLVALTGSIASGRQRRGSTRMRAGLRPSSATVSRREGLHFHRLHRLLLVMLLLTLPPSFAIDLSSWGRQTHSDQDWTTVQFRDPLVGKYLFSRAGTEDRDRSATLTLTASPIDACAAVTVIVIQLGSANAREVNESGEIKITIDDLARWIVPVRIIMPRGDHFAFLQFPDGYDTASLARHEAMTVTLQGHLIAQFSLKGFGGAWNEARSTCEGFEPR